MKRPPFQPVERGAVEHYPPGCAPADTNPPMPGDFILVNVAGLYGRLVQIGQGLRFRGADRQFCRWNHAALIVGSNGELVEAAGTKVVEGNLASYLGSDYSLVRIAGSFEDREEVVRFGRWCLKQDYAFLTILSILFSLLTGARFSFMIDGQETCSGLVARALERTSAIFNRDASHIMPADLAKYFQVHVPALAGAGVGAGGA